MHYISVQTHAFIESVEEGQLLSVGQQKSEVCTERHEFFNI